MIDPVKEMRSARAFNADLIALMITEYNPAYVGVALANLWDELSINAVHLVAENGHAVVRAETGGQWVELVREHLEAPFSHIVERGGIDRAALSKAEGK